MQLCSRKNKISCKDTKQVCSACLGLKHTQLVIENHTLHYEEPSSAGYHTKLACRARIPSCHLAPLQLPLRTLPRVLSIDEEEGQSHFILSEEEEDFEDFPFLPPAHLAQLLAAAGSTEELGGGTILSASQY